MGGRMSYVKEQELLVYFSENILQYQDKYSSYLQSLDVDEQKKAAGFKRELLTQRYVIAHGLLRDVLARYVMESAEQLRIATTERGKPFLVDYPELSFNLSHTENSWALAIVPQCCQLGIDIEYAKVRRGLEGLVGKCFSVQEAAHWQSVNTEQQQRLFYVYWVRKEAFVKAVGQGITLGLDQCVLNMHTELNSFISVPVCCGRADDWQIYPLDFAHELQAVVVCNQKNLALKQLEI